MQWEILLPPVASGAFRTAAAQQELQEQAGAKPVKSTGTKVAGYSYVVQVQQGEGAPWSIAYRGKDTEYTFKVHDPTDLTIQRRFRVVTVSRQGVWSVPGPELKIEPYRRCVSEGGDGREQKLDGLTPSGRPKLDTQLRKAYKDPRRKLVVFASREDFASTY
jgi:hypothetical protein